MFRSVRQALFMVAVSCAVVTVAAPWPAGAAEDISGLKPVSPQPASAAPGLAVKYYFNIFNDVEEVLDWADYKKGQVGKPLPMLDYRVGEGEVLTSGWTNGVGAVIDGMIKFDKVGKWVLAVHSNDGVSLDIGDEFIVSDPGVHSDRFSELVTLRIDKPGWYSLNMVYFEKRNTSTLELYWLRPGREGDLELVPAKAFAHVPTKK